MLTLIVIVKYGLIYRIPNISNISQMLIDCGENGLSTIGNHGQTSKDVAYALVKDEPNYRWA